MNDYWEKRQAQLDSSLEKSEDALKKRLLKVYEREAAKLDKEIAAYYQKYGRDNVIEYARLFDQLSDDDIKLLIERMDEFAEKYPEYAELMPVRESVYKLNRLEGLQESVLMHQYEIGAITNEQLQKHLSSLYFTNSKAAAKAVGLSENESIVKNFVDNKWAQGKDFSQRIWQNADKLANYLNSDISQGFARGDSYERLSQQVRSRFVNVAKNDAYRLVYTEGTYVMNEAQAKVFEQDFDEYEYLTAKDGKVCPVCSALSGKRFKFNQRQPNSNFPPMHPWCRCHFNPVVDDWDKWLDDYEKRNNKPKRFHEILGVIDPQNSRERKIYIDDFISKYKLSEIEHMMIIDRKGRVHHITDNLRDSISLEGLDDIVTGSYNIHNHPPNQTQYTFSPEDDIYSMFNDGTEVMEAFDYKYIYKFERPKNITFSEWNETYYNVRTQQAEILLKYGIDFDDYEENYLHVLIFETCKRLNIRGYKRWKK